MKKRNFLSQLTFASLVYFSLSTTQAQTTCDTCTQLTTLNAYAQDTSTNTAATSSTLNTLLERVTLALFGSLPALGNGDMMAAFSITPAIQSNAYQQQQALLNTVETAYQGRTDGSDTFVHNYSSIFSDYLLQEKSSSASFDEKRASIAALYLDPSKPTFYDETQQAAAETYIKLASGVAVSQMKKPDANWLTISSSQESKDRTNIRKKVSAYYTYSALQSAIADNFTYIYGLNVGKPITGTLDNYSGKSVSESGLFTYIQTQKPENPEWYKQLSGMGTIGLLREETILLGASFLMLSRIEEDLRRILITNSAQASISLISSQALTDKFSQMSQP